MCVYVFACTLYTNPLLSYKIIGVVVCKQVSVLRVFENWKTEVYDKRNG